MEDMGFLLLLLVVVSEEAVPEFAVEEALALEDAKAAGKGKV